MKCNLKQRNLKSFGLNNKTKKWFPKPWCDKRFERHHLPQFFRAIFELLQFVLKQVIWLLLVCDQSQRKEWEFLVARVPFE